MTRESRDLLAYLRSVPPIPEEDDPNGWYHQIREHLLRSPRERMERWAWFVGGDPRRGGDQCELQHVRFDPVRVVRALCDYEVAFVVVGMGAGYLRGAPYPSYNIDITPSLDSGNLAGLERVLEVLEARPLERDEWGSVEKHSLPGYRRLLTSAGMVNVVDAPWELGGYDRVKENAACLEVAEGLVVSVASLEDVINSKEAMRDMSERPLHNRTMDSLHVLMGREVLALRKKYGARWNLSTAS